MKSLLEFIEEAKEAKLEKPSKYDTTIYDGSNGKHRRLVPSDDENKNFIIARLGKHFFWATKGRSRNVDDYIEKTRSGDYKMNVQDGDPKHWEAEKFRYVIRIGTATLLKTTRGTVRLHFYFGKDTMTVTCDYGYSQTTKLGTYDIEDNPTDKEYENGR